MKPLVWLGAAWLAYLYVGYPVLLAILAWLRRVRPVSAEHHLPSLSILIAARNEEQDIGWKIAETLAWDYPPERLQVLVASDASADRTDEIVRGFADPRVQLVRITPRGGKGRALNRLAELARGELLLFTDANSHIAPPCLRRMVRHFADPKVGCVTGHSEAAKAPGGREPNGGSGVYWGFESVVRRLENAIGSVLVCDGAIFAIRASLFHPLRPELANDLELPMRIGALGRWVLHEPGAVVVEQDTSSPAEEFARRRRICAQGVLAAWRLRGTLRGLRGWQFFSHKLLRWLTLIPLAMIFAGTLGQARSPAFAALLSVELVAVAAALLAWFILLRGFAPPRFLSVPLYVLLTSAGALLGFYDACRGRRFDIWQSPSLTRGQVALKTTE